MPIASLADYAPLNELEDAGLLQSSPSGRYMLHQTISDYARGNLTDEAPYKRMATFFIDLAEKYEQQLRWAEWRVEPSVVALELDNFHGVMDYALKCGDGKQASELLAKVVHGLERSISFRATTERHGTIMRSAWNGLKRFSNAPAP